MIDLPRGDESHVHVPVRGTLLGSPASLAQIVSSRFRFWIARRSTHATVPLRPVRQPSAAVEHKQHQDSHGQCRHRSRILPPSGTQATPSRTVPGPIFTRRRKRSSCAASPGVTIRVKPSAMVPKILAGLDGRDLALLGEVGDDGAVELVASINARRSDERGY